MQRNTEKTKKNGIKTLILELKDKKTKAKETGTSGIAAKKQDILTGNAENNSSIIRR